MAGQCLVYAAVLTFTLLWCSVIVLEPLARAHGDTITFSGPVRFLFSQTCHQEPDRCYFVSGHPMPVCARCAGIYGGFLAGLIVYPLVRGFKTLRFPDKRIWLSALVPMGIEWLAGISGIKSPNWLRSATGLTPGFVASLAVLPVLFGAVSKNPPGEPDKLQTLSPPSHSRRPQPETGSSSHLPV